MFIERRYGLLCLGSLGLINIVSVTGHVPAPSVIRLLAR
jgi:hypothetical protein